MNLIRSKTVPPKSLPIRNADWLRQEFEARSARNPAFSQRSFSRWLGISSGRLSEYLSGKRAITPRVAQRLSEKLAFRPAEQAQLVTLAQNSRRERLRRRRFSLLVDGMPAENDYTLITEDQLRSIADGHSLALLNLVRTQDFQSNERWIAKRLGLRVGQVREILARLERLQLLRRTSRGWERTEIKLESSNETLSLGLRSAHQKTLQQAMAALTDVPMELRDITSITMAIDPAKLSEAKKIIRKFRRSLSDCLEVGAKTEVYQLSVALFPLTRVRKSR